MKPAYLVMAAAVILCGCSVYMASNKKGADFDTLNACRTKTCLIANGAQPLQISGLPTDTEAFKVLKAQGSTGRAVMHGVLDVATLGIWEIAGTPMEGAYNKDEYYGIRVTFDHGTENIKQISLAQ